MGPVGDIYARVLGLLFARGQRSRTGDDSWWCYCVDGILFLFREVEEMMMCKLHRYSRKEYGF